tara:strand:- start:180 stop:497 length:318 start_codon:yes stop_codon:yes gene_type:complete
MKITKPQLMQIIAEEILKEDVDMGNFSRLEDILLSILKQLKKIDFSIDYLSSAFTGESPLAIRSMQQTTGRHRRAPGARMVKEQKRKLSRSRLEQIIKEELERKK